MESGVLRLQRTRQSRVIRSLAASSEMKLGACSLVHSPCIDSSFINLSLLTRPSPSIPRSCVSVLRCSRSVGSFLAAAASSSGGRCGSIRLCVSSNRLSVLSHSPLELHSCAAIDERRNSGEQERNSGARRRASSSPLVICTTAARKRVEEGGAEAALPTADDAMALRWTERAEVESRVVAVSCCVTRVSRCIGNRLGLRRLAPMARLHSTNSATTNRGTGEQSKQRKKSRKQQAEKVPMPTKLKSSHSQQPSELQQSKPQNRIVGR